jgi:hypothetical protein
VRIKRPQRGQGNSIAMIPPSGSGIGNCAP